MNETRWPRIAIMGAGAVGGYYGAMLARAGAAVTLVGRAPHVEAIARDGLQLVRAGTKDAVRVAASTDAAAVAGHDVVLVCVKSTDSEAAARAMAPHLAPAARIVSLQNGVDNAARIAAVLSRPVLAAVVYVGAVLDGPGQVRHTGRGELVVGPLSAALATDRSLLDTAREVAAMFERAGVPCIASADVERELWTKLVMNCVFNAMSALGASRYGPMMRNPAIRALVPSIVAEVCDVARADGVALDRDPLVDACWKLAEAMSEQISSTAQDVLRGKRTEIDALNGFVARRGAAHRIATPINQTLHALVRLREEASGAA